MRSGLFHNRNYAALSLFAPAPVRVSYIGRIVILIVVVSSRITAAAPSG
jgi:hypothetical protein